MNKTLIAFIIVILFVLGFYTLNSHIYQEKQGDGAAEPTYSRITVTGRQICLPHKDTSGPQTLECALGLKGDNGLNYALDFNLMSQGMPQFGNDDHISVTGMFTPVEALSSEHWQKYDMVGILSVTDSKKI